MAELFAAAASGIGVASFAVQLVESVSKLKKLCDNINEAPEAIKYTIFQLEVVAAQVQVIANEVKSNPQFLAATPTLLQCLDMCEMGTDELKTVVDVLEKEVIKKRIWGSLKVVLKKDTLMKLSVRIESAKSSLMLAYMTYNNAMQAKHALTVISEMQKVQAVFGQFQIGISTQVATSQGMVQTANSARNSGPGEDSDPGVVHQTYLPSGRRRRNAERFIREYNFRLPFWITSQVWEVNFRCMEGRWDASIKTFNTVSDDSPLFDCCLKNDIDGVRHLFSTGQASPRDLDVYGQSALFYIDVDPKQTNPSRSACALARFLVAAGVDPDATSCFGSKAISNVSHRLKNSTENDVLIFLSSMTDMDALFVSENFFVNPLLRRFRNPEVIAIFQQHVYDSPYELVPMKQRLRLALLCHKHCGSVPEALDRFKAIMGIEHIDDTVVSEVFESSEIFLYNFTNLLGTVLFHGDPEASSLVSKVIRKATSRGIDLYATHWNHLERGHYSIASTLILAHYRAELLHVPLVERNSLEIADSAMYAQKSIEACLAEISRTISRPDAAQLVRLSRQCIFNGSVQTSALLGLYQFRALLIDISTDSEPCSFMFSWRLDTRMIFEHLSGQFWDMIDHPERKLPGAFNEFEEEHLDSYHWYHTARPKPTRNWMKKKPRMVEAGVWDIRWDGLVYECGVRFWTYI